MHNSGKFWTKIQKVQKKNPTAASEVLEQKQGTVHNPAYCTAKEWGWADHQAAPPADPWIGPYLHPI